MLVRRIVLLVLATGVLWKCLTLLLSPLAPDEPRRKQPVPEERAPRAPQLESYDDSPMRPRRI